jgi:hypothetical protein
MKNDCDELLVITWSGSQDQFAIETVKLMLTRNWNVFYARNPHHSDWIVVGFANTLDEAHERIEQMKRNLDNPKYGSPP